MIFRIVITIWLLTTQAFGALTASDRQFTQPPLELLLNPGFEFGRSNWTSSGGVTAAVTSGGNLLEGLTSLTWDSSGAAQTLCSSLVTVPEGSKGRPGIGAIVMEVPSGTSTHLLQVRDQASVVIATSGSRSYAGGANNSQRVQTSVFTFPSSGSVQLCLVSVAADEPLIALDSGTLRTDPWNLVATQSASLVASGVFSQTANCSWDNTTAGSIVAFTADADCPAPTLTTNDGPGTLDLTDTNLPQFTINNLPPSTCEVQFLGGVSNSGANNNTIAISDGTNTRNPFVVSQDTAGNVAPFNARATFTYTSAGNRTFSLFGRAGGGTTNIPLGTGFTNATPSLSFSIWCSPLQSSQALRVDQTLDYLGAVFYVPGATCPAGSLQANGAAVSRSVYASLFSRYGTAAPFGVGDGSTTFNLPNLSGIFIRSTGTQTISSIVQTAGTIGVAVNDQFQSHRHTIQGANAGGVASGAFQLNTNGNNENNQTLGASVTDGANGTPRSGASTFPANMAMTACISTATAQAPILPNSVISSSNGVERIERAMFAGASLATPCTSTPCTVYNSSSSSWLSSVSRGSAGAYTLNFAANVFSGVPVCSVSMGNNSSGTFFCRRNTTASATAYDIICANSGGIPTDTTVDVICMGPR
jgi:microcystin-dependent protein